MMRSKPGSAVLMLLAGALASSVALAGAEPDWDRAANIREAAQRLVAIQNERGALGTLKFIAACYQTHMLAKHYSKPLEACIAQDYMLSQTLALIYDRLEPDKRKQMGAPEPAQIAQGLSGRVATALGRYQMTQSQADELRKLVETEGFPVFFKERFPKSKL